MVVHVITARIYTGDVYFLGKIVATGLLGGWYKKLLEAEQYTDSVSADRIFEALIAYFIQPPMGRSLFDPWVLTSLYERARVVELGVARVEQDRPIFSRRRALNLQPFVNPKQNSLAGRPKVA